MSTIESTRCVAGACRADVAIDEARVRPPHHRSVFAQILRTAAVVAAAVVPGAGPAIGAIGAAMRRERPDALPLAGGESETLRFLEVQRAIEKETRAYEAASNIMKARHDATMNSIRNLRS